MKQDEQKTKFETLQDYEQALSALNTLQKRLKDIDRKKTNGVNIFYAVGMQTQEIKHSAFLAWLFDPNNSHGFETNFLRKFLERLITHATPEAAMFEYASTKTNRKILSTFSDIPSMDALEPFLHAKDISIVTERPIEQNGRIDIFLESQSAKTLIVIENKVFTSTHDDQLKRYEMEFAGRKDWKRIYIFLTPAGDLPEDDDGKYCRNWCVYSYSTILDIVREFAREAKSRKLKYILEDYIEMVNTEILRKKKELNLLCRQIRREHADAIEILMNYSDNVEDVMNYAWSYLHTAIPEMTILRNSSKRFDFYTPIMADFFERHGCDIKIDEIHSKIRCNAEIDGGINIGICLEKQKAAEWDAAQNILIERFEPDKKSRTRFISFKEYCFPLLKEGDREKDFKQIEAQIRDTMEKYYQGLCDLEDYLRNN